MHYEWNDGDEVMTVLAVWGESMDQITRNEGDGWQANTLYKGMNGYMMNEVFSERMTDLLSKEIPAGFRLQVLYYWACSGKEIRYITSWS